TEVRLDRRVELRRGGLLDELDRLFGRVRLATLDLLGERAIPLTVLGHYATSTPMERAVPSTILTAASRSFALRSGNFVRAISSTLARVILPTFSLFGTADPFSIPAALRIRSAAGGVFVTNVKERSSKTVTTAGTIVPANFAVRSLYSLMNAIMLMPCWPSAGPTGGAAVAFPASTWIFTMALTFFAIYFTSFSICRKS